MAAACLRQLRHVFQQRVRHVHLLRLRLHGQEFLRRADGLHRLQRVAGLAIPEDVHLTGEVGVAHLQPHHEAIQLCLGQQLRAGGANGVLGGDDHEGVGQLVGVTVHGDLSLLHDLQQRGLGLAGGAVDLVCQQKVGHHRAGLVDEGTALLAVQGEAHDVRGQHVRRELDAAVLQTQRTAESQRGGGLAGAGDIVQQHVSAGEHRHQNFLQSRLLAHDDLADLL